MRRVLPTAVLALLAAAASAAAQGTIPSGRLAIAPVDRANVRADVAFPGERLLVRGLLRPFIAGQVVTVTFTLNGETIATRTTPVIDAGNQSGVFVAGIDLGPRYGQVTIQATHAATPEQAELDAAPVTVRVIHAQAPFGARGPAVRFLQRALAAAHYAVPRSGVMDDGTGLAVLAFRKMSGLERTETADRTVFLRLAAGGGVFHVRYPRQGDHFEADLTHQVLAEVLPHGRVRRLIAMSSGKPSTPTVIGNFAVYEKDPGVNAKDMFDSNYFIRGYAIHGYPDVPPYPASHGCLRIPNSDAPSVFAWSRVGDPVDVYYRSGGGSRRVRSNAGP
jgi:hypothetical protein